MKKIIVILLLLLVCSIVFSQRKTVTNKLQVLDLKNAKILGLDSKGNAYDNSEYVQNKIDDLEIGTRNLVINRQDFELENDGAVSNSNVYTTQENGITIWRVERAGDSGRSYAYFFIMNNRLSSPLENGEYILSFDYTTTDNDGGLVRISGRGGMALESVYYYNNIVNKMGYWQRGFIPFEIKKNSQNLFLLIEPPNGSGSLLIKNIVVVRGTKLATDLPAPEDEVSDWAETNTETFSYIKNKPTKLSQFEADNIYTKTQSDARYMPSWDKDYNDLINKPTNLVTEQRLTDSIVKVRELTYQKAGHKIALSDADTLHIDNAPYRSTNITEIGSANGGYLMRVNGNGWDNPSEIYIDKGHISIGVQNATKNTSKLDIKNGSISMKNFTKQGYNNIVNAEVTLDSTGVYIPSHVTERIIVKNDTIVGVGKHLIIPEGVKVIKAQSFYSSGTVLTSVTIPSSMEMIEAYAFYGSKFHEISLPPTCHYKSNSFPQWSDGNGTTIVPVITGGILDN